MTAPYGEGSTAQRYLLDAQAAGMIGDDDWQASNDGAFYLVDFGDGQGTKEYTEAEIVEKLDPAAGFFNRPERRQAMFEAQAVKDITVKDVGSSVVVLATGMKAAEFLFLGAIGDKPTLLEAAETYATLLRQRYVALAMGTLHEKYEVTQ